MNPVILVADDHIMISKGLRRTLEYDFGYKQIHSVTSCRELLSELNKKIYTHLILDIGLSDGSTLEVLPTIQRLYPDVPIMIFSAKPAAVFERVFKLLNINHYMSKEWGEEETKHRLQLFFFRKQVIHDNPQTKNPFSALSHREQEVLHYILQGVSTKKTAETLNLKHNTISTVKKRIFEKTMTTNIRELIDLAELCKFQN